MEATSPSVMRIGSLVLVAGLGVALAGCGSSTPEWPSEPTVRSTSVASTSAIYAGAPVAMSAVIESGTPANDLPIGFFIKPASEPADCTGLSVLPATWSQVGSIGEPPNEPVVHHVQQRFVSTDVAYPEQDNGHRATVTHHYLFPDVPPGSYRVASAARADRSDCQFAPEPIQVVPTYAPDLLHVSSRLLNHSIRLPENVQGRRRTPGPDLVLDAEIANTGLPVDGPIEVAFALTVNGATYPLRVESGASADAGLLGGLPGLADRASLSPGSAGAVLGSHDVRASSFRLFLGEDAKAALRALGADATCSLTAVIDPDRKVADIDRSQNTWSSPVQYLAATDVCTSHIQGFDPTTDTAAFCFQPNGWAASHWGDPDSFVYVNYQFGGSEDDPAYFWYRTLPGTKVPTQAHFHTFSQVAFTVAGSVRFVPLRSLTQLDYRLPPTVDRTVTPNVFQFAEYGSNLYILGVKIFDFQGNVWLKSQYDFNWFKKEQKWVLFRARTMVGIIPVTFTAGAMGEIGLSGTAQLSFDEVSLDASLALAASPYAALSAFGEAAVNLVVASVGVGVQVELVGLRPTLQPYLKTYAARESKDGASKPNAGVELGIAFPLNITYGRGDFYLFTKVFGKKWTHTVASWSGGVTSIPLIQPLSMFLGPTGQFFVSTPGHETYTAGAIYQTAWQAGGTEWIGDISLDGGDYTFWMQNADSVQLYTKAGALKYQWGSSCGASVVAGAAPGLVKGNYSLKVVARACTSASAANPSRVWWTQDGGTGLLGLSGTSGYGTSTGGGTTVPTAGSPACGIQARFYNARPQGLGGAALPPDLYQCARGIDVDYAFDVPVNDSPRVNAPNAGLWLDWVAGVPLGLVKNGLAVMVRANAASTEACGRVPDQLAMRLVSGPSTWTWNGSLRDDGTTLWLVDKAPGVAGPLSLEVTYHSPFSGDPGCTPSTARDARLKVSAGPVGAWLVQTACTTGPEITTVLDGPAVPAEGTMAGGSVDTRGICNAASRVPAAESVVGFHDFGPGGTYDFVVGATVSEGYRLWIDGALVASRAVPAAPTGPQDCAAGRCATREKTFRQTLGAGVHVVEAYFDNQTGAAPVARAVEHRVRWTPVVTNQALVSFFASGPELEAAVYGEGQGNDQAYAAVEPLMVLKYAQPGPEPVRAVGVDWRSSPGAGDCTSDPAVNGQLDCWASLDFVADGPGAVGILWDGTYALADRVPYFFSAWSSGNNSRQVDLWVDGQRYLNYERMWPYPDTGQLYAFVQNANSHVADPVAGLGVNRIRLVSAPVRPTQATAQLGAVWSRREPYDYAVLYLDGDGNLTGDSPWFANYGPPEPTDLDQDQDLFTAVGGKSVPATACSAYIVAPPQGDPSGRYYREGDTSAIDLVATLSATPGAGGAGNLFDLCVNGACSLGNPAPAPGAPATVLASPSFITYAQDKGDPVANQGLFSQQFNNVVMRLYGSNGCLASPTTASYEMNLGYRAHAW